MLVEIAASRWPPASDLWADVASLVSPDAAGFALAGSGGPCSSLMSSGQLGDYACACQHLRAIEATPTVVRLYEILLKFTARWEINSRNYRPKVGLMGINPPGHSLSCSLQRFRMCGQGPHLGLRR
jgi:hypothetical protein